MTTPRPILLAGVLTDRPGPMILCPYDNAPIGAVGRATRADVEVAIAAAHASFAQTRAIPAHVRARILRTVAATLTAQREAFAQAIALEAGKPIGQARGEVSRAVITFETAADECSQSHDEVLRLDRAPGGEHRHATVKRVPIGPIAAIAPFNFPLNLVAHKVAPAIAAGCPIVLKPASQTPTAALMLGDAIIAAGWPAGALSVLPVASNDAQALVRDDRIALLSFTGSPAVGWQLKADCGRKRITLELGGNAGVIVHDDADIATAAAKCVAGGFNYAGQSCISVQRVFVQRTVYAAFVAEMAAGVARLVVGHPLDEQADLCSVIAPAEAQRIAEWFAEARAAGATFVSGGTVDGGIVRPTIITDAGPRLQVNCREVFAPVVTITPYDEYADAIAMVNDSDYGLQAAVFTRDVGRIYQAYDALEVGGLIVNDMPTWRLDPMPYGGVKHSGFGREGVRYAIEEMTEPKLMVINLA
jgi:acyl-CoA reductase-like NAD-dependent aldehyde dehydrogenase